MNLGDPLLLWRFVDAEFAFQMLAFASRDRIKMQNIVVSLEAVCTQSMTDSLGKVFDENLGRRS